MRMHFLATACIALSFSSADAQSTDKERRPGSILGKWTVVSTTGENRKAPAQMKDAQIVITDKLISLSLKSGHEVKFSYKLDPTKSPKTIDTVTAKGENPDMHRGIYDLKGDRLRLCLAITPKARPDRFDPKLGMLHVLRRASPSKPDLADGD